MEVVCFSWGSNYKSPQGIATKERWQRRFFFVIVNGNGAIFALNEHQIVLCAVSCSAPKVKHTRHTVS